MLQSERSIDKIHIKLGFAYYNQGFFNIDTYYSDKFGAHGSTIYIQFGDNGEVIKGYVNRTANPNMTPRIMIGKKYTEWVKKNYKIGDILTVELFSSKKLKLYPALSNKLCKR